ncbi:RmlC-like cupin domain-containing protein [Chaetomium tenue]|uniref:RmlC-like cupin domain-containing protein n=1 Tax=Chaetomium tenue TaxID=1854479 RepID=A0ACB7P2C6_9PEZI|nr:RmlC-like cupin domain-containing protein [Chaetomium globosum]
MFSKATAAFAALALPFVATALSIPAQLQLADTAVDRYQILTKNEDFVFDFNTAPFPMANRKTFPALVGTDIALAITAIEGCSMASLHIHPRSAEIFVVLSGRVITQMIPEGGATDAGDASKPRLVRTELTANQTTIFPQGSFHAQMNPECTPALAVAAFASDDPGAALVLPQAFQQEDEFVVNSFVGAISAEDLARFRKAVPQGPFFDVEACRKRCGL